MPELLRDLGMNLTLPLQAELCGQKFCTLVVGMLRLQNNLFHHTMVLRLSLETVHTLFWTLDKKFATNYAFQLYHHSISNQVGGLVSLTVNRATPQSSLSLSFTESSEFISPLHSDDSCRSVPTMDSDGTQTLFPLSPGTITQTIGEQRGGFKYLTIVSNDKGAITVSNVSLNTTWMPHWDDLRAYNGYFFARDPVFHDSDFLTKLWYAGAYTVQTNTIDSHQARQQPCPSPAGKFHPCMSGRQSTCYYEGWANNASGGPVDGPILVDGAKRDRCVVFLSSCEKMVLTMIVIRNIWPGNYLVFDK